MATAEQYREAQRKSEERRQQRLAAMRTREGVVDLAELRVARRALDYARSVVGAMPLVLDVRLVAAAEVGFEVVVTLVRDSHEVRVCLPSRVDDVPVRVVVRNAG